MTDRKVGWLVKSVIGLVAVVSIADLVTTCVLISMYGIWNEGNPVNRLLFGQAGYAGVCIFRIALTALCCYLFWVLARMNRGAVSSLGGMVAIVGLAIVTGHNLEILVGY